MLKNYFKFTWRHLVKDHQFTLLNLLGLSTGLSCAILIYIWVGNERSMDDFHTNNARLYQVMAHIKLPDGIHTQEVTPGMLAGALGREMPEVEQSVAVQEADDALTIGKEHFKEAAEFVGDDFFRLFSYRLIQGEKNRPFPARNSVLLSDQLAIKCFHTTQNIIGRTIQWGNDSIPYVISGIFEQPPANSTARFDLLFSYTTFWEKDDNLHTWLNSSPRTYLLLRPGANVERLSRKLSGYLQTKAAKAPLTLSLRKYSDAWLYNTYENGVQAGGRIAYVRLFSVIAAFILAIACINFMNLSTAKAARRAKELGIRKVAGASRRGLILQYLGESLLLTFAALVLAVVFAALLLPSFNELTGKQLSLHATPGFITTIGALFLVTGLVAGSYPALYLSGFKPVSILKGKLPTSAGEVFIRKGLVVFQFTLSALFIVAVVVIYRQMELVRSMDLGYNKAHVITFANPAPARYKDSPQSGDRQPFLTALRTIPGVMGVGTINGNLTGHSSGSTEKIDWQGKPPEQQELFKALDVDYDLIEVMGIKMAAGRSFSRDFGTDSLSIILNQAAVDAMGMHDPVGKTFTVWGSTFHIIGIAQDFHYESLYEKIKPCFMRCHPGGRSLFVKLAGGQEGKALAGIGKLYAKFSPEFPLDYSFIDKDYQSLYVSEQRIAVLSRYFAGLAVIISCLGLFGLAAFTAQKRQKEIGIRKVVGASVGSVVLLLSGEFLRLVVLAGLIAFPLSWWAMHQWLNGFAYHIHLSPWQFVLAGIAVLILTLLTTGYQAIRAAVVSPTISLRAE